jgi:hypothetical protein
MKLIRLIMVLSCLILIPGVTVVPSHATTPIPWIAFVGSGLDGGIYRMRADGSQLQHLSSMYPLEPGRQWSPD